MCRELLGRQAATSEMQSTVRRLWRHLGPLRELVGIFAVEYLVLLSVGKFSRPQTRMLAALGILFLNISTTMCARLHGALSLTALCRTIFLPIELRGEYFSEALKLSNDEIRLKAKIESGGRGAASAGTSKFKRASL